MTLSANQSVRDITAQYAPFVEFFSLHYLTRRMVPYARLPDSNYGTPDPNPRPINLFSMLIHTPHSLTVTMMSRITLRPKRFAQCSTTVDSNESHWRVSGRRRPSAARLRQHPRRVLGTPWLAAPPRAAFPPGLFASVPTPSGTFSRANPLRWSGSLRLKRKHHSRSRPPGTGCPSRTCRYPSTWKRGTL